MAKKGVLTKSDYLPYEEFLSTLEKLREDRLYWEELYFTIAFASALRVSDIRMLKWENVLNKNSIILIEKKTKKNREVRLNDETVSIIKLNSSYKCNGIHINNLFKFFVWCEVSKSFTRSII